MKAEKYVLALDQGTTSSRAVLFNHDGNIVAMAQKPIVTVPAATYTQDAATGLWTVTPGVAVLTVTGNI